MGFFDRFLDAIRLNDDYDDDEFYDDEEEDFDDDYDEYEEEKPKKRFFDKFSKKSIDDDFDIDEDDDYADDGDELDDFEDSPRSGRKSSSSSSFQSTKQSSSKARRDREREREREMREREKAAKKAKQASRKKSGQAQMNLNVIRPSSMEDTKDIADILKESRPVVLNLEGIDIDMAQRIIDFTCGVCYALDGDLKIVSNYIYLITPDGVDTYGDVQSILDGSDFEIPSMRSPY